MHTRLIKKETSLAVIGLGYVGLPIALAFARKLRVIAYDINDERIQMMKKGVDPSNELDGSQFEGCDITFTSDADDLKQATFYIVAVPTPVESHNVPDLRPLIGASVSVGHALKKGDYVVYESTVYPGCTEDDCIPILEAQSGLQCGVDFKVGYSPERINPGDKEHTLERIIKVVSGCDTEALDMIATVYELVVKAGVHRARSIKVAEAAKVIENTQRDVNIALMNELSKIFDLIGINTYDVLEAARTKWNFLPFQPGLVGGHCIGVDPYYLTYKSAELGYEPEVILSGRRINDNMASHVAQKTVQLLIGAGKDIRGARALVMGVTFKENVSDIRNSKVADLVDQLARYGVQVDVVDSLASASEVEHEYGFRLAEKPMGPYDAIILAVSHHEYAAADEGYFKSLSNGRGVIIDIKGVLRGRIKDMTYWSL
jgi:UDP-N-acetyl-D-galactosamine dehydrogenase